MDAQGGSRSETLTRHRNPIFDRRLGVTVVKTLTIDSLHCVYLGMMKIFAMILIWKLISARVFAGGTTQDELIENSVIALSSRLQLFYRQEHARRPEKKMTRVNRITPKMVGTANDPVLKTKGAETFGVLKLLVNLLGNRVNLFPRHADFLAAGKHLVDLMELWSNAEWRLTPGQIDQSMFHFNAFIDLVGADLDMQTPKLHLMAHMVFELEFLGNPKFYANWHDEALNKLLKKCCRGIAHATFDESVLSSMQLALKENQHKPCL